MRAEPHATVARFSTMYPDDLLAMVLDVKGPAHVGDEVLRDESPNYVQRALEGGILPFVSRQELVGRRILDFGCGSGASTCVLARIFPRSEIVGIDLERKHLRLAGARVSHYGLADRVTFHLSPSPSSVPDEIGLFDYVLFSAVYEHLLPNERRPILRQVWDCLQTGGVLFVNQLPNRYGVIEYHTTSGFPIINYLPDRATHYLVARFSKRQKGRSWDEMLRAGIRGGTANEILSNLESIKRGGNPVRLKPKYGARNDIELWFQSTSTLSRTSVAVKKATRITAYALWPLRGFLIPGVILAVRKV
jgi:2-polyprenyl-3-methyl-5-hydroxy-6-metoxy-1,4-benzoquinol methylase